MLIILHRLKMNFMELNKFKGIFWLKICELETKLNKFDMFEIEF
jgi:hypothetical protein